jgi:hypothetical protein
MEKATTPSTTTTKSPLFYYDRKTNGQTLSKDAKKTNRDVCVAGVIVDNKLQLGVSICGKKEQFQKQLARKISEGRAMKKPALIVSVAEVSPKEIGTAFVIAAKDLVNQMKKLSQ